MANSRPVHWGKESLAYYRYSSKRPPRELLVTTLRHLATESTRARPGRAIDLGFGGGTDTLELLRNGWTVLAVDGQAAAADFLARRVPPRRRRALTTVVAPMQEVELPPADLVYASYSLPFLRRPEFRTVWRRIFASLRPGGHFAGQLFGDRDTWSGDRSMSFWRRAEAVRWTAGYRVELFRETDEEGTAFSGPKHWHVYDLILEKPPRGRARAGATARPTTTRSRK